MPDCGHGLDPNGSPPWPPPLCAILTARMHGEGAWIIDRELELEAPHKSPIFTG
jgi:hypothetical protein